MDSPRLGAIILNDIQQREMKLGGFLVFRPRWARLELVLNDSFSRTLDYPNFRIYRKDTATDIADVWNR
jgi:hypothetical protein